MNQKTILRKLFFIVKKTYKKIITAIGSYLYNENPRHKRSILDHVN